MPCDNAWLLAAVDPFFDVQNSLLKTGRRIGMLTVRIPTMVSRTPHELIEMAEGLADVVRTTRMIAAAMTKAPEERRMPITIFFFRGT